MGRREKKIRVHGQENCSCEQQEPLPHTRDASHGVRLKDRGLQPPEFSWQFPALTGWGFPQESYHYLASSLPCIAMQVLWPQKGPEAEYRKGHIPALHTIQHKAAYDCPCSCCQFTGRRGDVTWASGHLLYHSDFSSLVSFRWFFQDLWPRN